MSDDRELKAVCRAFENNGNIPREYTGFGRDISPEFELKNLCENAVSIAVIPENIPCGAVVKELENRSRTRRKNRSWK